MTVLRIGVVGCAAIARRVVIPAIKSLPDFKLVAVASRSADKAEAYAAEFDCLPVQGYQNLIARDDIDAIYMPLPTGLHLEWAARALQAGKHLLVEKSMAMNQADALELAKLARARQLIIKENYMFEYHAQQAGVRELIQSRLGELRHFRACFGFPPLDSGNFRYDRKLGGGALLDAGGYVLKALGVFLPGAQLTLKSALLNRDAGGVDLWGSAMLEIAWQHSRLPAFVSFGFDNHYQCGVEAWGSRARLTTDRSFTAGPGFQPTAVLESPAGVERIALPTDHHSQKLLSNFRAAIGCADAGVQAAAVLAQASLQQDLRDAA